MADTASSLADWAEPIPLERPEPIVRAQRLSYILFEKPDLALMEQFLGDFGMRVAERSGEALYMRGTGTQPFIYAARQGPVSRYVGCGFEVAERADLDRLCAAFPGSAVEPVEGPGGGERVRLTDPNGFLVDMVHGRRPVAPITPERGLGPVNGPGEAHRVNRGQRPPLIPSPVSRLGHVVLAVGRFAETAQWMMRVAGLIASDVGYIDDGRPALMFLRLDRGDDPVDHHSIVLVPQEASAYLHSAYETPDLDAIGQGAQVLRAGGWNHVWGIGRHHLGSQLFDYWRDPYGDEVEHYADGDLFDARHPTSYSPVSLETLWAWGNDMPSGGAAPDEEALARIREYPEEASLQQGYRRACATPARPWLA